MKTEDVILLLIDFIILLQLLNIFLYFKSKINKNKCSKKWCSCDKECDSGDCYLRRYGKCKCLCGDSDTCSCYVCTFKLRIELREIADKLKRMEE